MPDVEIELPRDRVGVVAVRLLDQQQIAEVAAIAKQCELVLGAPPAIHACLDFGGIREPHSRLAEQIETDIGKGDVFLEHGTVSEPLAQALGEDQIAVGQAQQIIEEGSVSCHQQSVGSRLVLPLRLRSGQTVSKQRFVPFVANNRSW